MDLNDTYVNLASFLKDKIEYNEEMNLFIIENDPNGTTTIKFLNKSHFNFILNHFKKEIYSITAGKVKISHLNLSAAPLRLKRQTNDAPVKQLQPQRIELSTENNKTINKVIEYLYQEYDFIKETKLSNDFDKTNVDMIAGYGSISTLAKTLKYLESIKDYGELE